MSDGHYWPFSVRSIVSPTQNWLKNATNDISIQDFHNITRHYVKDTWFLPLCYATFQCGLYNIFFKFSVLPTSPKPAQIIFHKNCSPGDLCIMTLCSIVGCCLHDKKASSVHSPTVQCMCVLPYKFALYKQLEQLDLSCGAGIS